MNPIIKTEKISHVYSVDTPFERVAIKDVDFEAERGEYIGVIGHTGSGKSTFIQHLNGLLVPSSGRVLYDGNDIRASKAATRDVRFKVGLVFQYPEYQLFEETVFKDIAFGPRNMGLSETEIDARVREAAGFVGLPDAKLEVSPFDLSGGEKRRAAIAGVIAMRPEVLILDEPTAGLDPHGRDEILGNIDAYRRSTNATILVVTHSMDEIAKSADRLFVFSGGEIVISGTPRAVFLRGDELRQMGLAVPKVTEIAHRLRDAGVAVSADIYTIEQLATELASMRAAIRGGGTNA
ncbi:MAG: energy-coupling factor transporter ATPase [Oscillospiraceae bacterium]|jgi:energy-coupling factor transport system ATP-binding protein|nr:energy-coupling factor transporter ATPase [Oscillospiraceae bacterium]